MCSFSFRFLGLGMWVSSSGFRVVRFGLWVLFKCVLGTIEPRVLGLGLRALGVEEVLHGVSGPDKEQRACVWLEEKVLCSHILSPHTHTLDETGQTL